MSAILISPIKVSMKYLCVALEFFLIASAPHPCTMITPDVFVSLAGSTFFICASSKAVMERRFRAVFEVSPFIAACVWNFLLPQLCHYSLPKHLLWTLHFLKCYSTEHVNCFLWKCSEKSFRKWCWYFVRKIAALPVVSETQFVFIF